MNRWGFLVLAAACLISSVRAAEEFKVDEEGFIRNWLLLAPIALEDGTGGADGIDKELVKDEAKLAPKEGDTVKVGTKDLVWKKIAAKEYYFDVNEILGSQNENVCCYAVTYLVAEADMPGLVLKMSSNDQGKTYINGKQVAKCTDGRSIDKDQDSIKDITLTKGVNVIVHKVINESNNWQGAIRFTKDDKAVTNIKIVLVKP